MEAKHDETISLNDLQPILKAAQTLKPWLHPNLYLKWGSPVLRLILLATFLGIGYFIPNIVITTTTAIVFSILNMSSDKFIYTRTFVIKSYYEAPILIYIRYIGTISEWINGCIIMTMVYVYLVDMKIHYTNSILRFYLITSAFVYFVLSTVANYNSWLLITCQSSNETYKFAIELLTLHETDLEYRYVQPYSYEVMKYYLQQLIDSETIQGLPQEDLIRYGTCNFNSTVPCPRCHQLLLQNQKIIFSNCRGKHVYHRQCYFNYENPSCIVCLSSAV